MADTVTCPSCSTVMPASARFCPGCGRPRTATLAEVARESAASGADYAAVLERAHAEDIVTRSQTEVARRRRRRKWTLGAIAGSLLLIVSCGAASLLAYKAADSFCDTYSGPTVSSPDGRAGAHTTRQGSGSSNMPTRVTLSRGGDGSLIFATSRGLDPRDIVLTWLDDAHLQITYPTRHDEYGNLDPFVTRRDTNWRDVTIVYAPYSADAATPTSRVP